MHLLISDNIVSNQIYDKRDDFDFEIVNFPFLYGDFLALHYGVYISQLIRSARASSHVSDFITHNKLLTQKLLKAIVIVNFTKPFLNFIDETMI